MKTVKALKDRVEGRVFVQSDEGYESAKRGLGTTSTIDRQPVLIVQAKNTDDVVRTIDFACSNELDMSVRSGGHDMLGASTTPHGVLLDLCQLSQASLDPKTGLVRVGGGARADLLYKIGAPYNLAPILGMSPHVGVGGLILGGGIGWISGTFGAAVDHVTAVDVITVDGRKLTADAHQNTDLFWALRGGGGNFGVATAFTLQLHPLAEVFAGIVRFENFNPVKLLTSLGDFLSESPDSLDIEISFTLASKPTATVRLCWSGHSVSGAHPLRSLQRLAKTSECSIKRQRLADFVMDYPRADNLFLRGGEIGGLTQPTIQTIAGIIDKGGPEGCTLGLLHYMHGALCKVPYNSTPFIRPCGHLLYNIVSPSEGRANDPEGVAWAIETWSALQPVSSVRTYPNYLCEENEEAVQSAFGKNYERLRAIKRVYDPTNLFRNNRNIRP